MGDLMHGRVATYTVTGDALDVARKAEEGMLPIFRAQPGFKHYSLYTTGEHIISISAWENAEAAETANAAAADWVAENLADQLELQKTEICDILFSTPLGVSTRDRVTA